MSLAHLAMAGPSTFLFILFLAMPTLLAMSNNPYPDNTAYLVNTPTPYCDRPCQSELSLHLYLHQFVAGANHPNPNEVFVITTNNPFNFGTTVIHDWSITETVSPSNTVVARAQGTHIQASSTRTDGWYVSLNIVFESGRFTGSTLQVMGTLTKEIEGQWSIIGGTGEFTMAQGTIKYKMDLSSSNSEDGIRELDIHIIYTPNSPQAVSSSAIIFVSEIFSLIFN
ncbi:unnamed protein product [Alopecurus aequalis]